jgi:hypothetical protein
MASNTTAVSNTSIGFCAMAATTTGGDNTAVGEESLIVHTTGVENVTVGRRAGCSITTGSYSTAIGAGALKSATTPGDNTAVGRNAACNLTTGTNNFVFGSGSDAVKNITTDNHQIVIGNNSNTHAYIKIDWTVTSDLRDKTEIEDVPHGLDFISKITPIKYTFKKSRENPEPHGQPKYGFSAQEILALEGDNPVIIDNHNAENLKLTGGHLLPVLVNAIKELTARVKELENE